MGVDGCVSCHWCLFVAVCVLILKTERVDEGCEERERA